MKFENTEVWGFEHAIRGMRNPMNSWDKSDSRLLDYIIENEYGIQYVIGKNDLALMQKLIKAGSEHRKFMRQIFVSVDITAPLYWWKEFDTYKVGTTSNSTSTMHKLASTPITPDCFEMGDFSRHLENFYVDLLGTPVNWEDAFLWNVDVCEQLRQRFNETKDKIVWKELIRWLPESWLQTRTITMSYENILNMYEQRNKHKLIEWNKYFIEWCESLPYAKGLIMLGDNEK